MSVYMSVEMVWFECWACGVPFGMSAARERQYRNDGEGFFCIKGCKLRFGEGDVQRLQRELAARELTIAQQADSLNAARREAKRFKCPHCTRTYATRAGALKHTREAHQSPLRLAKDAGPSAHNTKVT